MSHIQEVYSQSLAAPDLKSKWRPPAETLGDAVMGEDDDMPIIMGIATATCTATYL